MWETNFCKIRKLIYVRSSCSTLWFDGSFKYNPFIITVMNTNTLSFVVEIFPLKESFQHTKTFLTIWWTTWTILKVLQDESSPNIKESRNVFYAVGRFNEKRKVYGYLNLLLRLVLVITRSVFMKIIARPNGGKFILSKAGGWWR